MTREPGHHIDGVVRAAVHQGEDQFARDLRGDHDSTWSYGPWIRTAAERDSEDWPEDDETRGKA